VSVVPQQKELGMMQCMMCVQALGYKLSRYFFFFLNVRIE
jgi:hypothetical protein